MIEAWIEAAASSKDLAKLAAIDFHLKARPEPAARKIRFKIAALKRAIESRPGIVPSHTEAILNSQSSSPTLVAPPPVNNGRASVLPTDPTAPAKPGPTSLWKALLQKWGIQTPDGRPLHRYRLDNQGREDLRKILQQRGQHGFSHASPDTAAFFVLWAAHWFQCEYDGGIRKWKDLGEALGLSLDGDDGRKLTDEGLRIWRRPPVRSETSNQRLRTLAVEGGFPAGILKDASRWAGRYLGRIVGALLSEHLLDPETAFAIAESQSEYIPRAYRQEIFYALAADLAMEVVRLRREVENEEQARGIPISAWLDAKRPGWRDELPIAAGTVAAAQLVDGLMQAEAITSIRGSAIGCERLLRREGGTWRPAIRLGLDGVAGGDFASQLKDKQERLRAHPARSFSRYVMGELALFEPPAESGDGWRVRSSIHEKIVSGVPFETPITVELRCDGMPVVLVSWPGGEPIRSEIGVFDIEGDPNADGCMITLIGTGSGAFRPEIFALSAPANWNVEPSGQASSVTSLNSNAQDGCRLWQIVGTAIVRSPEGDAYRIAGGQTSAQRDRLRLDGVWPRGLVSDEPDIELFAGLPKIRVCEGNVVRFPRADEIRWRPDGERGWLPMRERPGNGRFELAWRDPETGFIRDRRRIFILEDGAALEQWREADAVIYQPIKFGAAELRSVNADLTVERRGGTLITRFHQRPSRRAQFQLRAGKGRSLNVSAPFPLGSGIARWSGTLVRGGSNAAPAKLTIAELADCVAFSEGEQVLYARLFDRQNQPLPGGSARWGFRDELSLRGVADDLAALLLPFADIDVWAKLSFIGGREYWQVRQFEAALTIRAGQLEGVDGLWSDETVPVYGRSVGSPAVEVELGQSTPMDRLNRRPPQLSEDLKGPWLLYLRRGETVISRPAIALFGPKAAEQTEGLASAALLTNAEQRATAILACLDYLAEGAPKSHADARWLAELCASLRGLPPASLDPLRLLALRPGAAARVALHAADAERTAVLALSDGLPFAWCMVPYDCWSRAAEFECEIICSKVREALGDAADGIARKVIEETARKLAAAEVILQWPLFAAGLLPAQYLTGDRRLLIEAAQDHIRRYGDRVSDDERRYYVRGSGDDADSGGQSKSMFRTPSAAEFLPNFERFDDTFLENLDAPCAAAAVAAGKLTLGPDAVRRIKTAFRFDPIYFAEAFEAHFVDLLHRK